MPMRCTWTLFALRVAAFATLSVGAVACGGPDFSVSGRSEGGVDGGDAGPDVAVSPIVCNCPDPPGRTQDDGGDAATEGAASDATFDGGGSGATGDALSGDAPGDGFEAAACPTGQLVCDGGCVPDDAHHCGSCGSDCTSLANVSGPTSCTSGQCSFPVSSCAAGWADCNGNAADGCETDVTNPAHCGTCSNACGAGMPVCSGSGSNSACVSGCPTSTPTLCTGTCVDTTTNANHCGSCGNACTTTVAHAQPTCASSGCTFTCNSGYSGCSGGCADFQTESANCGGCGVAYACTGGQTCQSGRCACPVGTVSCGGTCVDTQSDSLNCGSCGHGCNGAGCSGALCGSYVIAQRPTTGNVARVLTDGTSVFWADNGANIVAEVPGVGGTAITLATAPSGYNIGTELAVANGKVAYFLEVPGSRDEPAVATVGLPNSASSTGCGAGGTGGGLSMDATATHIFFVDTGSAPTTYVRDCIFASQGGPGIVQTFSGTVLMQTVADANYMFYVFPQAGIYRDTIATFTAAPAVAGAPANSLAADGTYVYWTQGTIASSTLYRASEANPGGRHDRRPEWRLRLHVRHGRSEGLLLRRAANLVGACGRGGYCSAARDLKRRGHGRSGREREATRMDRRRHHLGHDPTVETTAVRSADSRTDRLLTLWRLFRLLHADAERVRRQGP
jgi:hypothetical protein